MSAFIHAREVGWNKILQDLLYGHNSSIKLAVDSIEFIIDRPHQYNWATKPTRIHTVHGTFGFFGSPDHCPSDFFQKNEIPSVRLDAKAFAGSLYIAVGTVESVNVKTNVITFDSGAKIRPRVTRDAEGKLADAITALREAGVEMVSAKGSLFVAKNKIVQQKVGRLRPLRQWFVLKSGRKAILAA